MKHTWIYTLAALCGIVGCGPGDGSPSLSDSGNGVTGTGTGTGGATGTGTGSNTNGNCDYPAGANDIMTVGDVIATYGWNKAFHRSDGHAGTIDLEQVPCASDNDIDWSPFDVLLFVSIPAW